MRLGSTQAPNDASHCLMNIMNQFMWNHRRQMHFKKTFWRFALLKRLIWRSHGALQQPDFESAAACPAPNHAKLHECETCNKIKIFPVNALPVAHEMLEEIPQSRNGHPYCNLSISALRTQSESPWFFSLQCDTGSTSFSSMSNSFSDHILRSTQYWYALAAVCVTHTLQGTLKEERMSLTCMWLCSFGSRHILAAVKGRSHVQMLCKHAHMCPVSTPCTSIHCTQGVCHESDSGSVVSQGVFCWNWELQLCTVLIQK